MSYTYIDIAKNEYLLSADGDKASIMYKHLKKIWGDTEWTTELHKNGNKMLPSDLYIIAKYGIMWWYYNDIIGSEIFDNTESLFKFIDNIKFYDIRFDEWKIILRMCYKFEVPIKGKYITEQYKNHHTSDIIIQKLISIFNINISGTLSTTKYMKTIMSNEEFTILIDELKIKIKKMNIKMYGSCDNLFETFCEKNPQIYKIGVVFQRTKIIDEKIAKIIYEKRDIDSPIINETCARSYIYKICDILQNTLYSWIYSYFRDFPTDVIEIDHHIIFDNLRMYGITEEVLDYLYNPITVDDHFIHELIDKFIKVCA
jgi:hypothetical protein